MSTARVKYLAAYIKNAREKKGLSQTDVSLRLGYGSSQFVSNWERKVSTPPTAALKKLVKILDLDPEVVTKLYVKAMGEYLRKKLTQKH